MRETWHIFLNACMNTSSFLWEKNTEPINQLRARFPVAFAASTISIAGISNQNPRFRGILLRIPYLSAHLLLVLKLAPFGVLFLALPYDIHFVALCHALLVLFWFRDR